MAQVFKVLNQTANINARNTSLHWDDVRKLVKFSTEIKGQDLDEDDSDYIHVRLQWYESGFYKDLQINNIVNSQLNPYKYTQFQFEFSPSGHSDFTLIEDEIKFKVKVQDQSEIVADSIVKDLTIDLSPQVATINPTTDGLAMTDNKVTIEVECDLDWEAGITPQLVWSLKPDLSAPNALKALTAVYLGSTKNWIAQTGTFKVQGNTTMKDSEIHMSESTMYINDVTALQFEDALLGTIGINSTEGKNVFYGINFNATVLNPGGGGGA